MKKIILLISFMFIPLLAIAANTTLDKTATDDISFIIGGTEQVSVTSAGNLSVRGNIITTTPTAATDAANKAYVDSSTLSGTVDWDDCEIFNSCQGTTSAGGSTSTTLSCTGGRVIVTHTCMGAGNSNNSTTTGACYLSAINSMYVEGNDSTTEPQKYCGSIKCCTVN